MPRKVVNKKTPPKKVIAKKRCPICDMTKTIATGFYKTSSPLYADTKSVPICIACIKKEAINEDGSVNALALKTICQRIDKPFYADDLESAFQQAKTEHSYLKEEEVARLGDLIIGLYFKNINSLRQTKDKCFQDSEHEGFIHQNSNTVVAEKEKILRKYGIIKDKPVFINPAIIQQVQAKPQPVVIDRPEEPLIYSDKWMGNYTENDIKKLDHYYDGLERDYKIITENHRDYARKIAKASLQMDKAFDDMMNGVEGADKRYDNAMKAFDTLSKSAKFSESTRSVNDVGISSFSKVAAMVEAHNWIPVHKPIKKDVIDDLIDYLSTITKSV